MRKSFLSQDLDIVLDHLYYSTDEDKLEIAHYALEGRPDKIKMASEDLIATFSPNL